MYILEVWGIASLENFTLGFSIQTLFPQVVNVSKEGLRHLQEPLGPGAGLLPRLVLTMVCRLPSVLAPQQLSIQCHLEAFPWSFTLGFLKKASLFVYPKTCFSRSSSREMEYAENLLNKQKSDLCKRERLGFYCSYFLLQFCNSITVFF